MSAAQLADEIEALAKFAHALLNNLPATIAALRERDALKAEVERLRAQDWQPIETAPKDGTRVLLWMEPVQDARFVVSDGPHAVVGNWVVWSEAGKRDGMRDGWSWYGSAMHIPTHWRPLPDPPSRAALGGGG